MFDCQLACVDSISSGRPVTYCFLAELHFLRAIVKAGSLSFAPMDPILAHLPSGCGPWVL